MSKNADHSAGKKPSKLRGHFTSAVAGAAVGAGSLFLGMPGITICVGIGIFGAIARRRMPQSFRPLTFAVTGVVGSLATTFAVFAPPGFVENAGSVILAPMTSMTSSVHHTRSTQPVIKFTRS